MKRTGAFLLASAALLFGPAAWSQTVPDPIYVAPTGTDQAGCGATAAAACATIQFAVDGSLPGTEIRVEPGTYHECVTTFLLDGGGFVSAEVAIVATDSTGGTMPTGDTVIDGTGACDDTTFLGVVELANRCSLEGFVVTGGAVSGVFVQGSSIISKNEIHGNTGNFGGGIYAYSSSNYADTEPLEIANNTVRDNTANADGGGVYVFANPAGGVAREVVIRNNTIRANDALDNRGGGIFAFTNASSAATQAIRITLNVIDGNDVAGAGGALGYGGGIYAATYGLGTETIAIVDNGIRNNTATGDGGGVSAWIIAAGLLGVSPTYDITLRDNDVSANTASRSGGGLDLYHYRLDAPTGLDAVIEARDNVISGNVALGDSSDPSSAGGGGVLATLDANRSDATADFVRVAGNTIRTNRSAAFGGGISLLLFANADPDNGGLTAPAAARFGASNNLIENNLSTNSTTDAFGGGIAAYLDAVGDATARAGITFDTIAENEADVGAGGIDFESFTGTADGAEGIAVLEIDSAIVADNVGVGITRADQATSTENVTIDIRWSDFFANSGGNYDANVGDRTDADPMPDTTAPGNKSFDPLLGPFFVPTTCSLTVDAGNPALDPSPEAEPNGDRVNMGHLGGSAGAARTFPDVTGDGLVDGVDVLRIAVAFGAASGDANRYIPSADRDNDGDIDGDDLSYVAAFFGGACP